MQLSTFGWDEPLETQFEGHRQDGLLPARVTREERGACLVRTEEGDLLAEVSGRFRNAAVAREDYPAVGDWVAVRSRAGEGRATIHAVLPRRSRFVRKAAGRTAENQVIAANVDVVFLVTGLDGNLSLRRIERYLTLAWDSGADPVVVLNKADLVADPDRVLEEVFEVACGVPVLLTSAARGEGVEALRERLGPGRAGAFLGSSGVGKSTLVNALLGEDRLAVREVRESDSRGRHTTTRRELIVLPGDGGLVIDTPGMRELQLTGDEGAVRDGFADVTALAGECRFRDCAHEGEPGCEVRAALDLGTLDVSRYESYLEQRRELAYQARRSDARLKKEEEDRWKRITVWYRKTKQDRRGGQR